MSNLPEVDAINYVFFVDFGLCEIFKSGRDENTRNIK